MKQAKCSSISPSKGRDVIVETITLLKTLILLVIIPNHVHTLISRASGSSPGFNFRRHVDMGVKYISAPNDGILTLHTTEHFIDIWRKVRMPVPSMR